MQKRRIVRVDKKAGKSVVGVVRTSTNYGPFWTFGHVKSILPSPCESTIQNNIAPCLPRFPNFLVPWLVASVVLRSASGGDFGIMEKGPRFIGWPFGTAVPTKPPLV